jgi:hypothetical protein
VENQAICKSAGDSKYLAIAVGIADTCQKSGVIEQLACLGVEDFFKVFSCVVA